MTKLQDVVQTRIVKSSVTPTRIDRPWRATVNVVSIETVKAINTVDTDMCFELVLQSIEEERPASL